MLAWSEGRGRQKTRNHGYDIIVGGELFAVTPIALARACHAKPKTQINGRRTYQLLSRWWDATAAAWPERLLSEKVRTLWHCSR